MQSFHSLSTVDHGRVIVSGVPFPTGEKVEVLVRPATGDADDAAWERAASHDFLLGYSEEDAAYDHYDE
ncbi:MAG: hypothetical protein ACHQNE_03825 [Candidatus Kapaibacterium sp.]